MNQANPSFTKIIFSATLPLMLLACGGGGGSSNDPAATYNGVGKAPGGLVPTTSAYVPVLVANGNTDLEISAGNSQFPNKEFVWTAQTVRAKSASVTYSGNINADGSIGNYTTDELLTVSDFTTGRVSMTPGGRPVYSASPSTNKLCSYRSRSGWLAFGLDSPLAISTSLVPPLVRAGSDKTCGTEDDLSDEFVLASFYDPTNQQAAVLFFNGAFEVRNPGGGNTLINAVAGGLLTARSVGDRFKTVLNAPKAALFEDSNKLWLIRPMAGAGSTIWSTPETKSLATTVGWEPIGYDENALYVYRNSSKQTGFGDWQVRKVDVSTGVWTLLDSGSGTVLPVMGRDQIWASAVTTTTGSVRVIYKNGAPAEVKSFSSLNTSLSVPMAAGGGRIVLFVIRSGFAGFEVYNESTTNLHKTIQNAYLSGTPMTGGLSINRSPDTGLLYVAQPAIPASSGHAGGTLASYDPVTDQTVTYGVLASAPIGGSSSAVGVPLSNNSAFKSFVMQGVLGNGVVATGNKKYSLTLGQANSLNELTSKVQLND